MDIKKAAMLLIGVILSLLGLLWFLQGAGIVHLKPLLCVANCEEVTGQSLQWAALGAVVFFAGVVTTAKSIQRANQNNQ